METYMTLVEGGATQGGGEEAYDAMVKAIESVGCKLVATYMLMGQYDMMTIVEAPNAEAAVMATYLVKQSPGNEGVKTQTLRAFTLEEMRKFGEIEIRAEG